MKIMFKKVEILKTMKTPKLLKINKMKMKGRKNKDSNKKINLKISKINKHKIIIVNKK